VTAQPTGPLEPTELLKPSGPLATGQPPGTGRRPRRWPWILTGLLLLGGGAGLLLRQRAAVPVTAALTTWAVQPGTVRVSVSGPGTLEAATSRSVGASTAGTVGALPAVGASVTRGQLLTTLTSSTADDEVSSAALNVQKAAASLDATRAAQAASAAQRGSSVTQASSAAQLAQQTLADAERLLGGQVQLYAVGAVSGQSLQDARDAVTKARLALQSALASASAAQVQTSTGRSSDLQTLRGAQLAVQQAQAALDSARASRAGLKVYAPLSGVVSVVSAAPGSSVPGGSPLLTVIDPAVMDLPVQVDETEIAGVTLGQAADVTLDAVDGQTFQGRVVGLSPGASQQNGISIYTATVRLDNRRGQLRPGMTAEAEIVSREESGLLVPNTAVETVRTRSYVRLAPASGSTSASGSAPVDPAADPAAGRLRVRTGATDGTNTVVTSGLQAGQLVVVPDRVKAATPVQTGPRGGGPPGGFGGAP
jgi:HlyD family secretion protein